MPFNGELKLIFARQHDYAVSRLSNISILALFFTLLFALLFACTSAEDKNGNITHDGKNLTVNFDTPKSLIGHLITNLRANVIVGDSAPVELVVDPNNAISGTISNVTPGIYDLVISYFVILDFLPTYLATVTKQITVVAGGTTAVQIIDSDLNKNIDSDNDGYTNLAEVKLGTNPNDYNDIPRGELLLYSLANASFGESVTSGNNASQFTMKSRMGEPLNGTRQSSNYVVVSGFRAY